MWFGVSARFKKFCIYNLLIGMFLKVIKNYIKTDMNITNALVRPLARCRGVGSATPTGTHSSGQPVSGSRGRGGDRWLADSAPLRSGRESSRSAVLCVRERESEMRPSAVLRATHHG